MENSLESVFHGSKKTVLPLFWWSPSTSGSFFRQSAIFSNYRFQLLAPSQHRDATIHQSTVACVPEHRSLPKAGFYASPLYNPQTVTVPFQVLPLLPVAMPLLLCPSSPAVHPFAEATASPTSGSHPTSKSTHAVEVGSINIQ